MLICMKRTGQRNFLRSSFDVWTCGRYGYKAGAKAQLTLYCERIEKEKDKN